MTQVYSPREHASPPQAVLAASDLPGGPVLATLLIVDDNEAALELERIMLVQRGRLQCNLRFAASGEEALAIIRELAGSGESVDLVLLDINMPKTSGFEVLSALREDADSPSVIMCSACTSSSDRERAHALGAQACVEKPLRLETLRPLVRSCAGLQLQENDAGAHLLRAA